MLIFTHIPRTGGTSLRAFVAANVASYLYTDAVSDLAFKSDAALQDVDFLATHCGFGVFGRIAGAHERMVLLREPVERVLSHYYYLRSLTENVSLSSHYAKSLSLHDFMTLENPVVTSAIENAQVWHLVEDKGLYFRNRRRGLREAEVLELAFSHLDSYQYVGVTERLPEFMTSLGKVMGWKYGSEGPPHLRSTAGIDRPRLEKRTLEAIRSRVALDVKLYEATSGGRTRCLS